ncbi:hypothetical protein [Vibrio splendidus]|uniref:hypothetical protein n=1 Tax=Vibrio splendidus TaxID=29497 RepID=UPI00030E6FE9|nr:hypothetical protein [Vibrio splendidus]OEF47201.1 hypothetical protein A150_10430 [Vibrio splendidus 1S-124]PTQ19919.1 hypothetical protein CWO14_10015 [Vibrio splendidus]
MILKKLLLNKHKFIYVFLNYFIQAANVALNLLMMRVLSPTELGNISLSKVFFQSAEYLHLGGRYSLDRYLPSASINKGKLYLNIVFWLYVTVGSIYFLLVIFFVGDNNLFIFFAISGVAFVLSNFIKVYHRAKLEYVKLNKTTFFILLFPIVIQFLGLYYHGFQGFIFSFFVSYLISCGVILCSNHELLQRIDILEAISIFFKVLFKPGLMLFSISIIGFIAMIIDRLLIANIIGFEELGYYSVILFFVTLYVILPGTISELALPTIINKMASSQPIVKYVVLCILITMISSLVFASLVFLFIDYGLTIIAPEYMSLISEIKMALLILIPFSITPFLNHYFNAKDKQGILVIVNVSCILVYTSALYLYLVNYEVEFTHLILLKVAYFTLQCFVMCILFFIDYFGERNGVKVCLFNR